MASGDSDSNPSSDGRERDRTAPGANKRGPESPIWTARKNEWIGLMDVAGLELEALSKLPSKTTAVQLLHAPPC